MTKHRLLQSFYILIIVAIGGLAYVMLTNPYLLFDRIKLLSYSPSNKIVALADESGMSAEGRRLFYVSDPQVLGENQFDEVCQFGEFGLVLGCYDGNQIFVLDVKEDRLEPVEPVTAAHEMLHAAYVRLSEEERRDLKVLLDEQYEATDSERITKEIQAYQNDPTVDLYNEMHSIFGSEFEELIPELEEYYSKYFSNRQLVLNNSAKYEKVFEDIQRQIERLDKQLNNISKSINTKENTATNLQRQIGAERLELDRLLAQDEIAAYNSLVPVFNSKVDQFNSLVQQIRNLIENYNELVEERNEYVYEEIDLRSSLDSDLETL